jgi:hypothetical protein
MASHPAKPSQSVQVHQPGQAGWPKGSICQTAPGSSPSATATPAATPTGTGESQDETRSAAGKGTGLGGDWPRVPGEWTGRAAENLRNKLCTVDGLKTALDNEIARREKALQGLITYVGKVSILSTADAATLTGELNSLIADLQTLKSKVDAETTVPDLQADLKLLQSNLTVYRTVWMWVHLVVGAEYTSSAGTLFDKVATKIAAEIATAQGLGKDTTAVQTLLDAMNASVTQAEGLAQPVSATLLALTPSQLADGSAAPVLKSASSTLMQAWKDLWTARMDAHKALDALKQLLPEPTPTATST